MATVIQMTTKKKTTMTTYKQAYKEFLSKLSEIESHYATDEGQNIQFSIAIQDEYEKLRKMRDEVFPDDEE